MTGCQMPIAQTFGRVGGVVADDRSRYGRIGGCTFAVLEA